MKPSFWLSAALLLVPACAHAQVRVNSSALQQLQGVTPAAPAPAPPPPAAPAPPRWPAVKHATPIHHHEAPQQVPHGTPKVHVVPVAPPPAKPATPAPPPKKTPTPPTPQITRVDFAPGSASVSAATQKALQPFCDKNATSPLPLITRAPDSNGNTASAMQLAMQRALALRTALIACGVSPQRIIPYAVGTITGADNNQALIGVSPTP